MKLSPDLKINFFLGAHRTAGQHLFHRMSIHSEALEKEGVYIPTMMETGRALSIVVQSLNQGRDINAVRQDFFDGLMAGATSEVKTLVIMSKGMLGSVQEPFSEKGIYGSAGRRCQMLVNLLQGFDVTFFMATRSPVPFAISCYGEAISAGRDYDLNTFMNNVPGTGLKWSQTIENMLTVIPADRLVVWPYEDYADINTEIAARLTGVDPALFEKKLRPLNVGLSLEGIDALRTHIEGAPHPDPAKMRALFDQYAEGYPSHELPINHPVFTAEVIEFLQFAYEDDWYYIERIEGLGTILKESTT